MTSCNISECNLRSFYEGSQSVDPLLIKRYTFQGMEIYALIKSLNLTQELLTSFCNTCNTTCTKNNSCPDTNGSFPTGPCKLVVDANQMLAIGYSHLNLGFPLVLSIFPNVELIIRNGGKLVIFNDNSFINYGCVYIDNSCAILESPGDHRARFINNGCITLRQSFLIGQGIIFNNGTFNAICYSKIRIGKNKENIEDDEPNEVNSSSQQKKLNNVQKALSCLDFIESVSRVINAGTFQINSYSSFELEGSFINGKNDTACCFFDQLCTLLPNETNVLSCPNNATFQLSGNSKFVFTFADNIESEFLNDLNSNLCFNQDTTVLVNTIIGSESKNLLVNKGTIVLNGESTFKNCSVDNYNLIETTYTIDVNGNYQFHYSKILFTNKIDAPKICNIGKTSSIRIAPTATLFIDGYNIINYGVILIGQNLNSANDDIKKYATALEGCARQSFPAQDLSLNASFFFGYLTLNTNNNPIVFKNFYQICIAPKSIVIIGKNSTQIIESKPQTNMLNQGQIFNFGLFQVGRNSEIINRPCPFNVSNEEFSIYNGGFTAFRTNSVILIRKPDNGNSSGGFIKSVSAYGYNGGKISNNSTGIIITWVGYQTIKHNESIDCQLIYGLQAGISGSGKIRFIAYPNISTWDPACLQQYLQAQANNTGIEYAF